MIIYGIKTCGTYKKAIKWFTDHNIAFETVDLRKDPPTKEQIGRFHRLSGWELKKFFNTSGKMYRELDMKHKQHEMTNDEIYQLLADHPMLIKRPLVVDGEYVRTGFKEEEYIDKWL